MLFLFPDENHFTVIVLRLFNREKAKSLFWISITIQKAKLFKTRKKKKKLFSIIEKLFK